jgi:drug/metabolite transporter (DMT)-like permease
MPFRSVCAFAVARKYLDTSVIYGLTSALGYGTGDYLSQKAGRAVGLWRSSFYYYCIGLVLLSIWIVMHTHELQRARSSDSMTWLLALGAGTALLAAVLLFTRGLIKGAIGVVAPVTASYGAVATALSLAQGDRFSTLGALGIALTVAGACIAAIPASRDYTQRTQTGVGWAAGAALAYGLGFWTQGQFVVPVMGPVLPMWVVYATGVLVMSALHTSGAVSLTLPDRRSQLLPGLAASILSMVGFLALNLGISRGHLAVVVVLSSLTSAITVLIAQVYGGERLVRHQWLAIALIVGGLILIRR